MRVFNQMRVSKHARFENLRELQHAFEGGLRHISRAKRVIHEVQQPGQVGFTKLACSRRLSIPTFRHNRFQQIQTFISVKPAVFRKRLLLSEMQVRARFPQRVVSQR